MTFIEATKHKNESKKKTPQNIRRIFRSTLAIVLEVLRKTKKGILSLLLWLYSEVTWLKTLRGKDFKKDSYHFKRHWHPWSNTGCLHKVDVQHWVGHRHTTIISAPRRLTGVKQDQDLSLKFKKAPNLLKQKQKPMRLIIYSLVLLKCNRCRLSSYP